jgi:hypothetical protein
MTANRNFPWWAVVLGIGCVCILCAAITVVGVAGYIFYLQSAYTPLAPPVDLPVPTGQPFIPEPTSPAPLAPATSEPSLTGEQLVSDFYLFDDFSSDALGWPVFDDGKTILKYEQGQYSFQIAEADYVDWAYAPVAFSPLDISFDVRVPANPQNGTFGVFCRFQDADNYYYVEFDLSAGAYVIGEVVADKQIPLTPKNAQGQYWQETSRLDATPGAVNRIAVTCYPDFINLFINSEWETEASVTEPFDEAGEMAFFVYAFPFAEDEGFKVFFDNVEIFTPVQ